MAFRPLLALLFCTIAIPQSRAEETPIDLGNERARFSYAIGYQIGSGLVRDQLDIDVEALSEAIGDAIAGIARLSREEQIAAIDAYRTRQLDQQNRQAVVNAQRAQDYLAKNRATKGVMETSSGLQYRVISSVAEGVSPTLEDNVTVHYRGSLIDGTQFDSSYDRGTPATFNLSAVIPGWQEGLQLMKVGETYQLTIPAELAYGKNGPPAIGPDQLLLFDVELISIN